MDEIPQEAVPVDQFQEDAAPERAPAADYVAPLETDQSGTPYPSHAPGTAAASPDIGQAIPIEKFKDDAAPSGAVPVENFKDDSTPLSPGETLGAVAERVGQGLIGPLAPALETAKIFLPLDQESIDAGNKLTSLTTPEEMLRRQKGLSNWLGIPADIAGFAMGPFGEAVGALGEGAKALTGVSKFSPWGAKAIATGVKAATELAAIQGGAEMTKSIEKDPDQTAGSVAVNMGLSAALGFVGGAGASSLMAGGKAFADSDAGEAVGEMLNKIKANWKLGSPLPDDGITMAPLLRRVLTKFGGVPDEKIEDYLARQKAINSVPGIEDILPIVTDHVNDVLEGVRTGTQKLDAAQANVNAIQQGLRDNFKFMGYAADDANDAAQGLYRQAVQRITDGLQQNAFDAAPGAVDAYQKLGNIIGADSGKAWDILNKTPGTMSLRDFYQAADPMIEQLNKQGFPERAAALTKVMEGIITENGNTISFPDAKTLVQGLQKRGQWLGQNEDVAKGLVPYFESLEGALNGYLKQQVPKYGEAMLPVDENMTLKSAISKYGAPDEAVRAIQALGSNKATYVNEMPLLRELEQKTGTKFTWPIDQYASPALTKAATEADPTFAVSQKTSQDLATLRDPRTRQMMNEAVAIGQPARELQVAQENLAAAEKAKENLKGLTPATVENTLKSVTYDRSQYAKEKLAHIPGIGGRSIPEILDLLSTRYAFEKSPLYGFQPRNAINGSRSVNRWSKIFGGIGALVSHLTGTGWLGQSLGQGFGAEIGHDLDTSGAWRTKAILDKYISMFGNLPKAVGATSENTQAGVIHMLDSGAKPDPAAFKASVNYIKNAKQGDGLLKRGAKNLFNGTKVIPSEMMPDKKQLEQTDEDLKDAQRNPSSMYAFGGKVGHYMPNHGTAIAKLGSAAAGNIAAIRPYNPRMAPLDEEIEPSDFEKSDFHDTLGVAQQPLMLLHHIQNSSLLPQHVAIAKKLYPSFYDKIGKELTQAMTDHLAEGNKVPYDLVHGLSLFHGQPMDSTFSQASLAAAQGTFNQMGGAQGMSPPVTKNKKDTSKLGEAAGQYRTQEQAAQARQSHIEE
jgi:hypothetical protein